MIKKFKEHKNKKISTNKFNINLTKFKDELESLNKFDMKIYEMIDIIDKLLKMDLNDIKEWKDHIIGNYTKEDGDEFTLSLIDKFFNI